MQMCFLGSFFVMLYDISVELTLLFDGSIHSQTSLPLSLFPVFSQPSSNVIYTDIDWESQKVKDLLTGPFTSVRSKKN